jgi:hypothetical protein
LLGSCPESKYCAEEARGNISKHSNLAININR